MSGEPVYESSEDKDEASQLTALREKKIVPSSSLI